MSCSSEDWQHAARHEEVRGNQGVMKAVIESPEFINQSASVKNRHTYYKHLVLPGHGAVILRVVVELSKNPIKRNRAYFRNAFRCTGEQQGEVRIWTKP